MICERCFQQAEMSKLDYAGISIHVCLSCCKFVLVTLLDVPVSQRPVLLETMKRHWQERLTEVRGRTQL